MNTQALGTVRGFCVPNVPSVPSTEETGFCGDANGSSGDATSSAHALLTECEARGIRLEALPGDRLDVDAPTGMLTAELVAALREHKAELLRLLAGVSAAGDPPHGSAAVRTLGGSVTGAGDDGSFGDCPVPGAHGSAAAPVIGSQDLTCPRCASVRIGQGRRWLWCIDCETRIGPADVSQDEADWQEVIDRDGRRIWQRAEMVGYDVADFPTPCPKCGGIDQWQDLRGGWHCEACEPRTIGPRLRETAQRLRVRYGQRDLGAARTVGGECFKALQAGGTAALVARLGTVAECILKEGQRLQAQAAELAESEIRIEAGESLPDNPTAELIELGRQYAAQDAKPLQDIPF